MRAHPDVGSVMGDLLQLARFWLQLNSLAAKYSEHFKTFYEAFMHCI